MSAVSFRNGCNREFGYLSVILAAFLWAASGTVAKVLFQRGMSPFQLVQLRTTIASVALFACLLFRAREALSVKVQHFAYFALLGIALAISQATYLYAISKIHVAAAILLQYLSPVLIVVYGVFFLHRRPSAVSVVAVAGALLGCYFMVGAYRLDIIDMGKTGIISGLASAVAFAIYTVKSEYGLRSYAPGTLLFYALAFAAVFWNIFYPPLSAFYKNYSGMEWLGIFFIGIFGTVLPFGLYNEGIRSINASHASITATFEPVIAGIMAYFFLGEVMEFCQVAGGFLVCGAVLLLQLRRTYA